MQRWQPKRLDRKAPSTLAPTFGQLQFWATITLSLSPGVTAVALPEYIKAMESLQRGAL